MAVMSALGKMWKDLPAASKKPYEEAAQKEKAAYLAKHPEGPPPRVRLHGVCAARPSTRSHAFGAFVQQQFSRPLASRLLTECNTPA